MSKFEDLIQTKFSHLDEAEGYQPLATQSTATTPQSTATTPQSTATTPQSTATAPQSPQQGQTPPQQGQQPEQQQEQQPEQQQPVNPSETLAQVFQAISFSNPGEAAQAMNDALKTAGNVPGMQEFFSSLAYDSQNGFRTAQQG